MCEKKAPHRVSRISPSGTASMESRQAVSVPDLHTTPAPAARRPGKAGSRRREHRRAHDSSAWHALTAGATRLRKRLGQLLGRCPGETKTHVHTRTRAENATALFVMTANWNAPRPTPRTHTNRSPFTHGQHSATLTGRADYRKRSAQQRRVRALRSRVYEVQ